MSAELALALSDLGGTLDWTAPADQALLVRPRPTARADAPVDSTRPRARPRPPLAPDARATLSARVVPAGAPRAARRRASAGAALAALAATGAWLWLRPGAASAPRRRARPVAGGRRPAPTPPAPDPTPTPRAAPPPAPASPPAAREDGRATRGATHAVTRPGAGGDRRERQRPPRRA